MLARANSAFAIANGWQLTSIKDKTDNTAVASKLVDDAMAGLELREGAAPEVRPYKLVFDERGELLGLQEVKTIPTGS